VVTKPKDLRSGRSVWELKRAPAVPYGKLRHDLATDVLVVGAGLTGAMVADALSAQGFNVVVVDRRGPAKGSSTASTALVQYEIDKPLFKLRRSIGQRDAVRAWRRSRLAVDALAVRLRDLGISGVSTCDTLYLAGNLLDVKGLHRELDARLAAGFTSRFVDRRELQAAFGMRAAGAILSHDNMTLDPRRTTLELLRASCRSGAKIFAPADIVDARPARTGVVARTSRGNEIRTQHLVLATGYEFPTRVPQHGHETLSTWAIATVRQPLKPWLKRTTIWEASDPYIYVRCTPDGRVICGGEDESSSSAETRDALIGQKAKKLQHKLGKLLPDIDTRVDFAWAGSFGASGTGLPTIGPIPRMKNCWAALGYGGNGTTYAQLAADIIAGALTGRPDSDADLYEFGRQRP
jgi:glycine/D-amino acid oxidase-like deaminating enzyme